MIKGVAPEALGRARAAVAARRGAGRPRIPLGDGRGLGRIYYLAGDVVRPSGGVWAMYQHVDRLNELGLPAAVLHQRPGFRCSWFANRTVTVSARDVRLGSDDILVASELDADLLAGLPPGPRHVVLNQSGHLTWRRGTDVVSRYLSTSPQLRGVLTVSEHSTELLRYAFPHLRIHRVPNRVDPDVFPLGRGARRDLVVHLSRRGAADAALATELLRARGVLRGWQTQALDGLTQAELAARLREAKIFLAVAYQEGFGMPSVEAMSSGCYVVGMHGFGGREFLRPPFAHVVEPGDVLGLARAVEATIEAERAEPGWCAARGAEAAAFVQERYSLQAQRVSLEEFFRPLLKVGSS